MKKKGLKVLAAAVLLTLGTVTMSAFAAEGWTMSNNAWVYLDSNGRKVSDEWRRGADNLWRYLNYKGEMAINTWADDEYFVDVNGIMVTNSWVKTVPQYDQEAGEQWFYFGSSGKMATDGWKQIDGVRYLFDENGVMQTGWTEDGLYYLGADGGVETGWKELAEPVDEDDDPVWEEEYIGPESENGKYWFYFSSNGKKYCPETSTDKDAEYRVSKISGEYYCFDENGRMMTGWVYLDGNPDTAPEDSIEGWRYFAEAEVPNVIYGAAVPGWLSLLPPERLWDTAGDEVVWYYFASNGEPKYGPEKGEATTSDFVKINGNTYLFDACGNPATGLQRVKISTSGEYTSYCFDENSKLALRGKETVVEGDGTESVFYFNEGSYAGRGYTGVKSNYLYYMGKRQEAEEDTKYQAITIPEDGSHKTYVVSESGRVAKGKTVKDADDVKYTTDSKGILTHVDGAAVGNDTFADPIEPVFEEE